jgi:hypothetical protein
MADDGQGYYRMDRYGKELPLHWKEKKVSKVTGKLLPIYQCPLTNECMVGWCWHKTPHQFDTDSCRDNECDRVHGGNHRRMKGCKCVPVIGLGSEKEHNTNIIDEGLFRLD